MRRLFIALCFSVVMSSVAAAQPSSTETLILPVGHDQRNTVPLGASNSRYQQVYAASAFDGPMTISQLSFLPGYSVSYSATMSMKLGTTTKPVNGLEMNQNNNITGPMTAVISTFNFSGNLTAYNWWALPLDQPFTYDPADGNLALEWSISAPQWTGSEYVTLCGTSNDGIAARSYPWVDANIRDNYGVVFGLTTLFTYESAAAAPVPGAGGAVAVLLAALIARRRR